MRVLGPVGAKDSRSPATLDFGDGFAPTLARAAGHDDVRSATAEPTATAADAARRAGDERDLSSMSAASSMPTERAQRG
jgi:hypothetical protein